MFTKKKKVAILRVQALILSLVIFLTLIVPTKSIYALAGKDQTENADIIRELSLKYMLKGTTGWNDFIYPYKIEDGTKIEKFHAQYSFILNETEDEEGGAKRTMQSGDYYLIDLPNEVRISNPINGNILGNGNKPIADYSFLQKLDGSWQVKIQFTEYIDDTDEFKIQGNIEFDFDIDLNSVEQGTSTTIYIPIDNNNGVSIDIKKPIPPQTMPISLNKTVSSYDHKSRELIWNIEMIPETGIFSDCVFTDTIDMSKLTLKDVKHGNITLIEGQDYSFDKQTGKLEYKIPKGRDGRNFKNITITTVASRDLYGDTNTKTISNKANLSGGESFVNIDSNVAETTITPEWLKKEGTLLEGNSILWTINTNITNQLMYDAIVTDRFTVDVKLDKNSVKLGDKTVIVYDNTYTPLDDKEVYGIYINNDDGTSELRVYMPRSKANASDNTQKLTLKTDIVSPKNKTDKDPVYNNTASLECKYITDSGIEGPTIVDVDTVGVPVPYISIIKGHSAITSEDKRNGTITWTISAQSNLSEYGKSQIFDVLPDDQDYIENEIYWGNQKINENTNPKAEISEDARKLTITFNNNNALQEKQYFTIKTKIKKDIYGNNINRNFTNEASSVLYSMENEIIAEAKDSETVRIQNSVISKTTAIYNENITGQGENPRVNFNITINSNLMPLGNVVVTDNLNNIITEFKKDSESSYSVVNNVKWTYVPNTLKITKNSGNRDNLDLMNIINKTSYINNTITVDFGDGILVNDKYTISFTAELDISQNDIFKENGNIRSKGNIAEITADGLKKEVIKTPATGYAPEIKNQVLDKSGIHIENEQQALWTINLNQHRVVLDHPRVEDILPKGLTLDPTSIKLYTKVIGKDGNFITGKVIEEQGEEVEFSYKYLPVTEAGMEGRYKLIVDLPNNETDYILRFATDVDRSLLGQGISNSAYYAGESAETQNYDTSFFTLSSSSGGSSERKAYVTVNKKSKDNNRGLDGAEFALHWIRNGDTNNPVFVRTMKTTSGTVVFRGLTRGERYTVTEVTPPNGYLLDSNEPVEFIVPSSGTVDLADIDFYNTPIKLGSWNPKAIKKLDGKEIIHTFKFEILDGLTSIMTGVTKNELANGDYTIDFSMKDGLNDEGILNFTNDHTFSETDVSGTEYLVTTKTFYMREVPLNLLGYRFDDTVHKLLVKVINVKGQDRLKIVVEDENGNILTDENGNFKADKIPYFQNNYRANGSIKISGEKIINGHSLDNNQFSFEIYEGNNLIETVGNKIGYLVEGEIYKGNIDFSPINYTQSDVGIKNYTIIEKNTGLPGYTYDTAIYTVEVGIVDNDDGTISSSIQSIKKTVNGQTTLESNILFNNTYTTSEIDMNLMASKFLIGRDIEDNQFSFALNKVNSEGELVEKIGVFKNTGNNIYFPQIRYKQSDIGSTYYYQIEETSEEKSGYIYDNSIYNVKVNILDNDDGTLTISKNIIKDGKDVDKITFTNKYRAIGKAQIIAKKTLVGKALMGQQFSFALQQIDGIEGVGIGEEIVVRNDNIGIISFPEIEYTEADAGKDFYYKIYEKNQGIRGYTYDTTVYTVIISVEDNGDGTLSVKQKLIAPKDKNDISFENKYVTSNTSLSIDATKILKGRTIENRQFTFVLNKVTEDGILLEKLQQATNNEDGSIKFDDVIYTQEDMGKIYYYQLSEVNDGKPGYTYDTSIYTIKVEVIDNDDGTLKTVYDLKKLDKNFESNKVDKIEFSNSYRAEVSVNLSAKKILEGMKLIDKMFEFRLMDESGQNTLQNAYNDKDGNIIFESIIFNENDIGTHKYIIKEVSGNEPGMDYDKAEYIVIINVTDNGDGTLGTEVSIVRKFESEELKVDDIQFVNKYKSPINGVLPNTGDYSNILFYIGAALFSISSLLLMNKKRVKKAI